MSTEHDPRCYQSTGVPDDLPANLCDCRVLRMIDDAQDTTDLNTWPAEAAEPMRAGMPAQRPASNSGDVEALARHLYDVAGFHAADSWATETSINRGRYEALADAVRDSDWLAAHDAQVRREAVEQIAREWQFGGWTILTAPPPAGAIPSLALGQRVTDWLRAEADR